jgi:membrane protease YdiL (CAAX protease family)
MELMFILGLVVLLSIVLLANVGLAEAWARDSTHLLIGALNGSLALFGIWALVLKTVSNPVPQVFEDPALGEAFLLAARDLGLVSLVTALLASLFLLRPVRRVLIGTLARLRLSALDPGSPVHTTMLVFCLYLLAWTFIQWLLAGDVGGLAELSGPVLLADVLLSGVLAVAFALMGIGLGVRRTWKEVFERLGIARLETRSLTAGVLGAGAMLGFQIAAVSLWFVLAPESLEELGSANSVLVGEFASFPAALAVAVSTAIGEELLFRGALQPRLGLLPTSILFALLHVQYTLSPAALVILVVGLGLGLLRSQYDTTAAVVAHFVYNFALLALALTIPQ